MSSEMYQEIILDYYRNPRNFGTIENAEIKNKDLNPLCGDVIEINIKLDKNSTIADAKFTSKGCAISTAAASMLTEFIVGKQLDEIKQITKEDVLQMLSIPISFIRLKCALLGLKVLKVGVYDYLGQKYNGDANE